MKKRWHVCRRMMVLIGLAFVSLGCSAQAPQNETTKVEGLVTINGTPLPRVAVTFFPVGDQPNGRPTSVEANTEGHFALDAAAGANSVTIAPLDPEMDMFDLNPKCRSATETPLEIDLPKGQSITLVIEAGAKPSITEKPVP
ncbi:hypothetical protein Pan216_18520 [Planctomycetes bacterium Pan216]|uniref:Carboxypeptidase regulatory-like domain-containing protein n=1 Tax=Kolteria novifilia TaxID=2527975 RepID=A0A518B1Z5_9BACT|nr:hypothetical protein Pan216_18520 [Planctomycetes bacterium Pan216]